MVSERRFYSIRKDVSVANFSSRNSLYCPFAKSQAMRKIVVTTSFMVAAVYRLTSFHFLGSNS